MEPRVPNPSNLLRIRLVAHQACSLLVVILGLVSTHHPGDIARKFQSRFNLVCCKEQSSGELQSALLSPDW
jgi:hypothetical protein